MTGWMSGKLGEDLDCERENELSGRRKVGWRKIFRMIREQIAHWMEATLDDATDPWGVKVERVEM